MTLEEFFTWMTDNPSYIIFYFAIIPFAALLAGILGKGEGTLSPWKYLYSALLYLICVPGIFAVTLSIYYFLFERIPILETNLFTQVLPILSMLLTIFIVRNNVNLDKIPGFDKLSGLIMIIAATLGIMWFIDKTRIWVITYLPFQYVLIFFVALLLIIRFGWSKLVGGSARE